MWLLKKIIKVCKRDHVTDEDKFERTVVTRGLINTIKRRKTNWIDHVQRYDSMLRNMLERQIEGKQE